MSTVQNLQEQIDALNIMKKRYTSHLNDGKGTLSLKKLGKSEALKKDLDTVLSDNKYEFNIINTIDSTVLDKDIFLVIKDTNKPTSIFTIVGEIGGTMSPIMSPTPTTKNTLKLPPTYNLDKEFAFLKDASSTDDDFATNLATLTNPRLNPATKGFGPLNMTNETPPDGPSVYIDEYKINKIVNKAIEKATQKKEAQVALAIRNNKELVDAKKEVFKNKIIQDILDEITPTGDDIITYKKLQTKETLEYKNVENKKWTSDLETKKQELTTKYDKAKLGGNKLQITENVISSLIVTFTESTTETIPIFPREILYLPYLVSLIMDQTVKTDGIGIKNIPSDIDRLVNLRCLSLKNNQIEEIPDSLTSLVYNLDILDLSGNNLLKVIPGYVGKDEKQYGIRATADFFEAIEMRQLRYIKVDTGKDKQDNPIPKVIDSVEYTGGNKTEIESAYDSMTNARNRLDGLGADNVNEKATSKEFLPKAENEYNTIMEKVTEIKVTLNSSDKPITLRKLYLNLDCSKYKEELKIKEVEEAAKLAAKLAEVDPAEKKKREFKRINRLLLRIKRFNEDAKAEIPGTEGTEGTLEVKAVNTLTKANLIGKDEANKENRRKYIGFYLRYVRLLCDIENSNIKEGDKVLKLGNRPDDEPEPEQEYLEIPGFIKTVNKDNIKPYEDEIGLAEEFVKIWAFCVKQNYENIEGEGEEKEKEKKEKQKQMKKIFLFVEDAKLDPADPPDPAIKFEITKSPPALTITKDAITELLNDNGVVYDVESNPTEPDYYSSFLSTVDAKEAAKSMLTNKHIQTFALLDKCNTEKINFAELETAYIDLKNSEPYSETVYKGENQKNLYLDIIYYIKRANIQFVEAKEANTKQKILKNLQDKYKELIFNEKLVDPERPNLDDYQAIDRELSLTGTKKEFINSEHGKELIVQEYEKLRQINLVLTNERKLVALKKAELSKKAATGTGTGTGTDTDPAITKAGTDAEKLTELQDIYKKSNVVTIGDLLSVFDNEQISTILMLYHEYLRDTETDKYKFKYDNKFKKVSDIHRELRKADIKKVIPFASYGLIDKENEARILAGANVTAKTANVTAKTANVEKANAKKTAAQAALKDVSETVETDPTQKAAAVAAEEAVAAAAVAAAEEAAEAEKEAAIAQKELVKATTELKLEIAKGKPNEENPGNTEEEEQEKEVKRKKDMLLSLLRRLNIPSNKGEYSLKKLSFLINIQDLTERYKEILKPVKSFSVLLQITSKDLDKELEKIYKLMSHYKNSKQIKELEAAAVKAKAKAAKATKPEKQAAAAAAAERATNEHTKAKEASTVVNDILKKYFPEKLKPYIKYTPTVK